MKKLSRLPYLAVFLANLLVGYLGGSRVLPVKPADSSPSVVHSAAPGETIPALANGQRSLLLVTVEDLEARKPRLTSVWMLLFVPTDSRLTLLPIFPSLPMIDSGAELVESFRIHEAAGTLSLDPVFLENVRKHVPWWSGYILLDETALAEVANKWMFSSGVSQEASTSIFTGSSEQPDGSRAVAGLPHAWDDPYSALFGQASLYQELCWGLAWANGGFQTGQLQALSTSVEKHFSTDLDPQLILSEFQNLTGRGGNLVCEFPTLSVQARVVK